MTISQAVDQAIAHHRAGRLREAEVGYRQVLQAAPDHPAALHYLGSLAMAAGHVDDALKLMKRSLEVAPQIPDFHHNYALALRHAGRVDDAIGQWREVLKLRPGSLAALENIGSSLHSLGRIPEAIVEYRAALAIKDDADQVRHNLGLALVETGDLAGALDCFDRVLARQPQIALTHNARGNALRRLGRFNEAIAAYQRAIELAPKHIEPHVGLGNVLKDMNRPQEAVAAYQKALTIEAAAVPVHNNLGSAYQKLGKWDEALASYDRAIALAPGHPESHWNRSMVLLLRGDFDRGWEEYEWRFKCRDYPGGQRTFDRPRWEKPDLPQRTQRDAEAGGASASEISDIKSEISNPDSSREPLRASAAKPILLHAEQGLGDTVQFVRYAAAIRRLGYRVIVESPPELAELLRTMKDIDQVVAKGEPLPAFDVHAPMLSLPLLMRTTLQTIPADVPYLHAAPEKLEAWRQRLKGDGPAIGLVWAGSPRHPNDRHRSISLQMFAPLLAVPGIRFFSLQKGPARDQLINLASPGARVSPPAGFSIAREDSGIRAPGTQGLSVLVDLADDLPTLLDTAAAVSALDLVITVDTLAAHLAGALARPVWTLLPFDPDWRWLLGRDDSPWYPTMRLFRQKTAGDWGEVVARVADAVGQVFNLPPSSP